MKIFYSWQSDLDKKYNRSFIKDALESAINDVNRDLSLEEAERIEIDHDTKGVPGTPDLAPTIFEKISNSFLFIADVSFIGKGEDGQKYLPNPNVMIELGYAISKLGSDRVVCVMNTAYGKADLLPFDLRHKRHPIQYQLDGDVDKTSKKNQLVGSLKGAIQPILQLEKHKDKNASCLSANPSRKDIFDIIMTSDSKDDWERLVSNEKETTYFKDNVNLRFEQEHSEAGVQCENFCESWANNHADPNATGYWLKLFYGSTHIDTYILVAVDGGRALLPIPRGRDELVVNSLFYKVAQINDRSDRLNEYMVRSGLTIEGVDLAGGFGDGSGYGGGMGSGAGDPDGSGRG